MMTYLKVWLALLIFFSVVACDDQQQDLNLVLPENEQSLIVECYLEPGQNYRALVTRTMNFLESKEMEPVDSVKVSVFVDGEEKELLNQQLIDTVNVKFYNYWLPEKVEYQEGKEYQIEVTYGDKVSAVGTTRFLPKAEIKEVSFLFDEEVDSLAAIFVQIKDKPGEKDFYRLVVRGLDPAAGYTYEGLWNDADASEGVLTAYSGYSFWEGNIVIVNVYRLEEQYYQFLKSLEQARESNYNPFMQPATIRSSLDGGTGIFAAITLTSDTVKVGR